MLGKREKQAARWYSLLASYELSGISQAEFCRREGLKLHNFGYWYKKYKAGKSSSSEGFVSVLPKRKNQSIYIRYRSGVEVELPSDFGVDGLAKLLSLSLD